MRVLGIETSCDETGVAVVDEKQGLIGHRVYSQIALHREYGGVVPELASRDHVRKLLPLTRQLLSELGMERPDAVAYTAGPGLLGALMVGALAARAMAWGWGVPALGVHHLEGHLLAPMLEGQSLAPPFLALLVSGGHSLIARVQKPGVYEILGQSLDDAAGEAFDKTAKLLGLPYPGGPALAALAKEGNPARFSFPRPMTDRPGLDMSFSGLKTHALVTLNKHAEEPAIKADIARAFEDAVIDTLLHKCVHAVGQTGLKHLIVAGGVGANQRLREKLGAAAQRWGGEVHFPSPALCTDNGAMIAYAGLLRLQAGQRQGLAVEVRARWPLGDLAGSLAA